METIELSAWSDYREAVLEFCSRHQRGTKSSAGVAREVLFRGQTNASWPLETTLERMMPREISAREYVRMASKCAPQLESLSGRDWGQMWDTLADRVEEDELMLKLPALDYLIYLRHRGFPSPLLDWTTSPYVAAYFAFRTRSKPSDRVSVYAFAERPNDSKIWSAGEPRIESIGPYVNTDARHYAQKARYTYCTRFDPDLERHYFACHHSAIERSGDHQDILCKFTVPASERIAALRELADYNIDDFTLFQDEDALVRSVAMKELELEEQMETSPSPLESARSSRAQLGGEGTS